MSIGALCVLARNTGTDGSPVWSEVGGINNFDPKEVWRKQEAMRRARVAVESVKTVLDRTATGTILRDSTDANYLAFLESARKRNHPLDLMILDGPIDEAGSSGFRGKFLVMGDEGSQNVEDVLYMTFTLEPALVEGADSLQYRVEVGEGGAITYTLLEDYVDDEA